MSQLITGIQQVGIGVENLDVAWRWYRKYFGMDVPVFQETGEAELMSRYTGGSPARRTAVLAANMQGGGAFEVWQYEDRQPQPPRHKLLVGDLGINIVCLKSSDINASFDFHRAAGITVSDSVVTDPAGKSVYEVKDTFGNLFRVEASKEIFLRTKQVTGGISSVVIGVSDIDKTIDLYKKVLGYSRVVYESTGKFDYLSHLPGGNGEFRCIKLSHGMPGTGSLGRFIGATSIELLQALDRAPARIYEKRFWGDLGFMHVCFDIYGMDKLKAFSENSGFPFTVDSGDTFNMGKAQGRFAYTEDADGTLVEMVETFKMPLIKKIGLYLDLTKRNPAKPLPDWMLKTLRFSRIRDKDQVIDF